MVKHGVVEAIRQANKIKDVWKLDPDGRYNFLAKIVKVGTYNGSNVFIFTPNLFLRYLASIESQKWVVPSYFF